MSDISTYPDANGAASEPPAPRIKSRSWPSLVWLIPLVTALIGAWLIVKTLSEKGPTITITFRTAEGIEAGTTRIKYKDIEIGVVDSVHFNEDFSHVIVKAAMKKETQSFLKRDTRFWVVKPRLTIRGASGLGTFLSGAYIEIEPGRGASQRHFTALDRPPVVTADVPGKKLMLLTGNLGSIDTGSPVYYQGITAGEILGWELANDRKSIFVHTFIKAPYDKLVRSNTRFWNVSGVDISLGSDGINVRTESVQALLYGGVAFDTPDTLEQTEENVEGLVFTLYDNYDSIREQSFIRKIAFILFFDSSVRGLSVGASVEFKGIKIGSVKDIRLEFDSQDTSFRIPVLVELEPGRIIEERTDEISSPYQTLKTLVDRGLRAQLQTASLITGQLYVELGMHPDTPVQLVSNGDPYPELPTIPASLDQLTTSVKGILAGLEGLEVDKIGAELLTVLQETGELAKGANKLISRPELAGAMDDLMASLHAFRSVVTKLDQRTDPLTTGLQEAIGKGNRALEDVRTTLNLINGVLEPGSPFQFRFLELTEELAETARSIRILVDLLERDPSSVIFGKDVPGE